MNQRYKKYMMWALYSLLFLLVMLLQTAVFGRERFFGVKLSLIPVVLVCISICRGHEQGGLFCLIAAFVWYLSGAEDGPVAILTLTVCGILAGFLCTQFAHRFLPSVGLCFAALLIHEGAVFLLRYYLGAAEGMLFVWVLKTAVLSLPCVPVCYGLAKLIGKVDE